MNKQKGLAPILIVILVALAVGGYLIYQKQVKPALVPQQVTQPSPSPIVTPVASNSAASPVPNGTGETANWKTYTNTKYGFSFKYPEIWVYSERNEGSQISLDIPQNKDSDGKVLGKIELIVNGGAELLPENLSKADLVKVKNISVEGIKVQEVHHHVCPSNGDCIALFFKSGNNTFYLHSNADSEGYTNLPILYQILSTFKFLDQNQNKEAMIIKGQILDKSSQPFKSPDLVISSVDSSDKCNVDSLGNFTCSAKLIKGKTYGIYLNDLDNKKGFTLQYFGGNPGQTLDLGIKKAPW